MELQGLIAYSRRIAYVAALSAALVIPAGCADAGHPRGQFTGRVMDKTTEEVTETAGKPESTENVGADRVKWIYKRKTFDPDNMNKPDEQTILTFKRDTTGKLKVEAVDFL